MRLWNKFLVVRRDNTVPDWPYLVMGARDPYAPAAIRTYAQAAAEGGEDQEYVDDLLKLASSFEEYATLHGHGDPAVGPHRTDDPTVVNRIKAGSTPDGWKRS